MLTKNLKHDSLLTEESLNMDEPLIEVTASDDSPKQEVPTRLMVVLTDDSNQKLVNLLQTWVKDGHRTRNLSGYNPVRLNSGALILDDTEYTRAVCVWLKSRFSDQAKIFEVRELFPDHVDSPHDS